MVKIGKPWNDKSSPTVKPDIQRDRKTGTGWTASCVMKSEPIQLQLGILTGIVLINWHTLVSLIFALEQEQAMLASYAKGLQHTPAIATSSQLHQQLFHPGDHPTWSLLPDAVLFVSTKRPLLKLKNPDQKWLLLLCLSSFCTHYVEYGRNIINISKKMV